MATLFALALLFAIYPLPVILCGKICQKKNRNVAKGVVVGLLTGGWIGCLILWLGLKTRTKNGRLQ